MAKKTVKGGRKAAGRKTAKKKVAKAAKKKVAKKTVKRSVKKAVKKTAAKRVKKAVKKTTKKTAKKAVKKAARKTAKKATKKAAKKVTRKVTKRKAVAKKPAAKAAPKRAAKAPAKRPAVTRRPAKRPPPVAPQIEEPVTTPAPVIDVEPTPPPPVRPEPMDMEDRGPRFFEPDDMPGTARPDVEGPYYEDHERDRPFYDTESVRTEPDDVDADLDDEAFGDDEEEEGEEDDEEDCSRGPLAQPPPAAQGGVAVGQPAPDFELPDEQGRQRALRDYRGRKVVLYFYPRDNTPGCTREACGFRDALSGFDDRHAAVLGISPDSPASHERFAHKYSLTFPLLADENHAVAARYGAWGMKSRPGGKSEGLLRTTFIIDEAGRIAEIFRNVRPEGHEQEVLAWLDRNWLSAK